MINNSINIFKVWEFIDQGLRERSSCRNKIIIIRHLKPLSRNVSRTLWKIVFRGCSNTFYIYAKNKNMPQRLLMMSCVSTRSPSHSFFLHWLLSLKKTRDITRYIFIYFYLLSFQEIVMFCFFSIFCSNVWNIKTTNISCGCFIKKALMFVNCGVFVTPF